MKMCEIISLENWHLVQNIICDSNKVVAILELPCMVNKVSSRFVEVFMINSFRCGIESWNI